ncbi:GGDEF domain-containing protein [Leucothrix arctica]|nr:GGDEF domain-containing protein [Leucothrix arctica]
MIPILFVEVALIAFYFISVNYMTDKTMDVMSQTANQSLVNLSVNETRYINNKLKHITRSMNTFQKLHQAKTGFTYDTFAQETLPVDLPWGSGALILDSAGEVLVSSNALDGLVDKNVIGSDYIDVRQPYTKHDYLRGTEPLDLVIQDFIAGQLRSKEFQSLNEQYFITQSIIDESGWRLVILTDMKSIYAPIYEQKTESKNLGYLVILLIINFYVAFFIYLMVASKRFARRITQPIETMTKFISQINQQRAEESPPSYVKIRELDTLIDLNVELQEAKQKYVELNVEMSHKNDELKRLSVTDPLTQAYNRLKLDEVLSKELERSVRDKKPLSIILLDIDKFKHVNDTYGHQVGDSVLVALTQALLKNIQSTDVLGRWGGEEFLIILPNTSLENAVVQAEKLRLLIEFMCFDTVGKVTASLGVSCSVDDGTECSLIERADKALYKAKEAGRNCVKRQERVSPLKLKLVNIFDGRSTLES